MSLTSYNTFRKSLFVSGHFRYAQTFRASPGFSSSPRCAEIGTYSVPLNPSVWPEWPCTNRGVLARSCAQVWQLYYYLNIPCKVRALAPPLPAEAPAGTRARSRTRVCACAAARARERARMPSTADRLEAALLLQFVGICTSQAVRLFPAVLWRGAAREKTRGLSGAPSAPGRLGLLAVKTVNGA